MYAQKYAPPSHNQGPGAPPTSGPVQGGQVGYTPMSSERVSDILEQVKRDYATIDHDYERCKSERDEFERKLDQQLAEFQNMKQTIVDLEMNYNSIKQQYEDRISQLKQQLENALSNNPPSAQQQMENRLPASSSASPSNSPPFLNKAPTHKVPSNLQPPSSSQSENIADNIPSSESNMGRNESSPYPFARQSGHSLPPISLGAGVGNSSNASQPSNESIPSFPHFQEGRTGGGSCGGGAGGPINPDHPFGNRPLPPQSNYDTYSSNPSLIASINNINNPHNTDISMQMGMIDQNGMLKNGKSDNMVKKEGNDWVVVFNPQVQTNINVNLAHNIEQQGVVCCVRFSADGKYLATGSNKQAQIYDVDTGKRVLAFPANPSEMTASISNGANVHISSKQESYEEMSDNEEEEKGREENKAGGEIDHDDPLSTALGGSIEKEDSYVRSVCFSPDGQYLVAGAEDKTVKVWDINARELKYSFVGHELDIYSLDFSSDSRFIVSGSGDGKTKIWNMATGQCDFTLGNEEIGPKEGVTSVAISPDGRTVAAGSLDCVVRMWDTQTGKFLESFKGHDDSVYSVAFSPDGKMLASGSLDRTLKLWDLTGSRSSGHKCISTLSGHRDYVLSVAFSPDGKWLMSGSKDRSVQFWDPRTHILHLMLQGHKNSVISVALNPVRQMFATGSGDFRARVWQWS